MEDQEGKWPSLSLMRISPRNSADLEGCHGGLHKLCINQHFANSGADVQGCFLLPLKQQDLGSPRWLLAKS